MSPSRDLTSANGSTPTERPAPAGRVLVLDEDLVARAESVVALTRGGFVVVCIEDPREAASRARDGSVDLVLADLAMASSRSRRERRRTDPARRRRPPAAEGYAVPKPPDRPRLRDTAGLPAGDDGGPTARRSSASGWWTTSLPADPETGQGGAIRHGAERGRSPGRPTRSEPQLDTVPGGPAKASW
jgi:CheY-like chemotaxis protein